jgi:hypothetical protein
LAKVLKDGDTNRVEWVEAEYFLKYVKHFVSHVKLSKELPTVLLLDKHNSHLSKAARDYCKRIGLRDVSFPTPLPSLAATS